MKKTIIIGAMIMITVCFCVVTNLIFKAKTNETLTTVATYENTYPTSIKTTEFVIEIKGAVKYPGIYVFYTDEVLVNDLILKAGGVLPLSDTSGINLASLLENHSSVYIAYMNDGLKSYIISSGEEAGLININTATIEELKSLPSIGEALAQAIVLYRKDGYFTSIEEIKNVDGIGDAIFEKIKDYITV